MEVQCQSIALSLCECSREHSTSSLSFPRASFLNDETPLSFAVSTRAGGTDPNCVAGIMGAIKEPSLDV